MAPKNEEEKKSLMGGSDFQQELDSGLIEDGEKERVYCKVGIWKQHKSFVFFHLAVFSIYTALFWSLSKGYWDKHISPSSSLVYSPAQEAVQFKKQRFHAELIIESEYIGDPTPETDRAWHELLENMNIAVPASDLKKINARSIAVPGEPDKYIAGLSVYHELHCLKRLRQDTWSDHYFPNQTAEDKRLLRLHTDHCIDVLRQAILCHADPSLFTLQWSEKNAAPRADFSHEHQCVDWDVLNSWAAERRVPAAKMKHLEHPFGKAAFPNGHGNALGASEDQSPTVWEHSSG